MDPSPHPCYQLKLAINLLSANTHTHAPINKCINDADPSPNPCPSRKRDLTCRHLQTLKIDLIGVTEKMAKNH